MTSSKKVLIRLLPWLLIFFGFCILNFFEGFPGGVLIILGTTILMDRLMPVKKGTIE